MNEYPVRRKMPKTPACPTCSQAFATKEPARPHGPRLPLLLRCGHTYCEGCLTKLAKAQKTAISCPSCQVKTPLTSEEGTVNSLCPNIYLLGQLALNRKHGIDQVGLGFMKIGQLIQGLQQRKVAGGENTSSREFCSECLRREATCRCIRCDSDMCGLCFDKIHSVSKVLKKHQAVPLYEDKSFDPVVVECRQHDNRPIEYFCEDCKTAICSHCVIVGVHKEHAISAMENKNQDAISLVEPAMKSAARVLKRLRKSYKVLEKFVPQTRETMLSLRENIHAHFQILHAKLQAREMEILVELDQLVQRDTTPLDLMKTQLYEDVLKTEVVLKDSEKAVNNEHHLVLSAQNVLTRLNQVAETPCFLDYTKQDNNISFNFDLTVFEENLKAYGKVEGEPQYKLSLTPLANSQNDDEEEEEQEEEEEDTASTSNKDADTNSLPSSDVASKSWADRMSELDSDTSSITSSVSEGIGKSKKSSLQKSSIQPKHRELVYVTHIKNPCHFMVQCCSATTSLDRLTKAMQKHCANTRVEHIPKKVKPDDVVLAQFSQDKTWYRARVRDIVLEDDDPTKAKVDIIYVDFGNTEIVPQSSLRKMPQKLQHLPELAMQASLLDIVSADESGQWTVECVHTFAKMTEDKPMMLLVHSHDKDGNLKVDLSKPEGDDYVDDRPVSVRDALVFLELAAFTSVYSEPPYPGAGVPKPKRRYLKPAPLTPQTMFDAYVTHINSPNSFYVQQVGEESAYLVELMSTLQRVYSSDQKDMWTIFCPQLDMICVAKYEVDNQWYRAQVVGLPGRRNVDVFYVDFGNVERVSYLKLKYIQESLMVLPVQSIHCQLAGIEPQGNEGWSSEAIARFSSFNLSAHKALVRGIGPDKLQVELYTGENKASINRQLVVEGVAISTDLSEEVKPAWKDMGNEEVYHFKQTMQRPSAMVRTAIRVDSPPQPQSSVKAKGSKAKAKQNVRNSTAPKKQPSQPPAASPDDGKKKPDLMEVLVTHFHSPSHFYIQLTTAKADGLDQLMANLEKTFRNSEDVTINWQPEDHCAVLVEEKDVWYRAKVVSKDVDKGTVQVFMLDYGYSGEVYMKSLRPLQPSHRDMMSCALRCHLLGVQPAGDPMKWSHTACEVMEDELKNKSVYLAPKGEVDSGSVPIDLLIEHTTEGDALNPETTEYLSLTEILLEKGVALPRRTLTRQTSVPQVTKAPKPADCPQTADTQNAPETPKPVESSPKAGPQKEGAPVDGGPPKTDLTEVLKPRDDPPAPTQEVPEAMPELIDGPSTEDTEEFTEAPKPVEPAKDEQKASPPPNPTGGPDEVDQQEETKGLADGVDQTSHGDPNKGVPASQVCTEQPEPEQPGEQVSKEDLQLPCVEEDAVKEARAPDGEPISQTLPDADTSSVAEAGDGIPQFEPAKIPSRKHLCVVPTFVDWNGIIFAHEVKEDQDCEGRFGFFLKENTLETVIQDKYLSKRSLYRARIPRDGNCLFRAFAQAIFVDQGQQGMIRKKVVQHLKENWDSTHGPCSETEKKQYLAEMAKDGTYGGEPEVNAVCKIYNVTVDLYLGGLGYPVQVRRYGKGDRTVIRLVYISDGNIDSGHYDLAVDCFDALMPIDDIYQSWRQLKISELRDWPKYSDDTSYDDSLLHQLMEYLDTVYRSSVADLTHTWTVGQSVIARYSGDGCFYRARITDIQDSAIKVLYLDFGNSEMLSPDSLRQDLVLEQIPVQCIQCKIAGIKSTRANGVWPKAVLDYLHKLVVGVKCTMDIVEELVKGEPLSVELTLADGRDLAALLRDSQLALSEEEEIPDEDVTLTEEDLNDESVAPASGLSGLPARMPQRKVPSPFLMRGIPDPESIYLVIATHFETPNQLYLQHVRRESSVSEVEQEINRHLDELLTVAQRLNAEAEDYPPMACIKPGVACCARYSCDNCWYRGEVITVIRENEENRAGVLFVDYGSFEYVGSDRLRQLPIDLMSLPAQGLPCQVANLQPPGGVPDWEPDALAMMTQLLTDKLLLALFTCVQPVIEVELYNFSDVSASQQLGEVVYSPLISAGLAQCAGVCADQGTIIECVEVIQDEDSLANEVD